MNPRPGFSATNCFFFGLASAVFSIVIRESTGKDFGPALAGALMSIYAGFAFQPTKPRALIMSAGGVVWCIGVYFFFERRDITGFAVMLACFALCLPIVRRFRPDRVETRR